MANSESGGHESHDQPGGSVLAWNPMGLVVGFIVDTATLAGDDDSHE